MCRATGYVTPAGGDGDASAGVAIVSDGWVVLCSLSDDALISFESALGSVAGTSFVIAGCGVES